MGKIFDFFRRLPSSSRRGNARVNEEALEFFNSLTATLEIELSEPAQPVGGLLNLAAPPTAQVSAVRLDAKFFDAATETSRPLTKEELETVVFTASVLTLCGERDTPVSHQAPEGERFTVQALLTAIEATERQTRGQTQWLGGIDVHHIYFEGLHPTKKRRWEIAWGS